MKRALYIQRPETKELPVLSAEVAFQRLISALEAYGTVDELNSHRDGCTLICRRSPTGILS